MSENRVITVQEKTSGTLIKVCENTEAYKQWLSGVDWTEDQVKILDARVRPEL